MNNILQPTDFPVHALPAGVREAVLEVHHNMKAPVGLIASSALTSISLAAQSWANVQRMNGLEAPINLWFLTIAESGERKTAVDSKFLGVIREFEAEQAARFSVELSTYIAAMSAWRVKEKAILRAFKQNEEQALKSLRDDTKETCYEEFAETLDHDGAFEIGEGETDNSCCHSKTAITSDDISKITNVLRARLDAHYATKPSRPKRIKMIYDNATPSAIVRSLSDNWPSIGLISDEGAGIFNGRMVSDLSLLNSMWGGAPIYFERVDNSIVIPDPRLTFSIQIQPGPLKRYFERKGDEAHDTGFSARFLICYPTTTQGERFIQHPVTSWEHLPKFNARIRELLDRNIRPDGEPVEKITLIFTPGALSRWIVACNAIEDELKPGRYFFGVKGFAAKIADNLARMAALFHLFKGGEGPIPLDTLEEAITVLLWYTEEFVRLFSPPPQIPQEQIDATQLEIFFAQQVSRMNSLVNIKRNYVLQYGPPRVREKARLSVVLDVLFSSGKISFSHVGKTCWICLNPTYFTPEQVQFLCAQGAMNR